MRNEPIDFIGVDYSIADRNVEGTILPLAQERKIGVVAYFTFGPRGTGSLFQRAGTTPLPEWAAELDANTWGRASRSTCSTTSAAAPAAWGWGWLRLRQPSCRPRG